MLAHKLNFKVKIALCLRKNFEKVKLKIKNQLRQQTSKQANETNNIKKRENGIPSNPTRFSERFFTFSLPVSILKFY